MEKEKNKFFSNNKKMIKTALVLYIAIAVAITGTTVAWFLTNKKIEVAPSDEISITADSRVEISLDGEVWGSSLKMSPNITQYADVSGNGIDFWFPRYLSDTDEVDLSNKDAFQYINTAVAEQSDPYFITLRLKVRSATPLDLYLDGTVGADGNRASYVLPKDTEKVEREDGELVYPRPSLLNSEITTDYIAAATRVAFVEATEDEEILKSVWIPNDKTELYYDDKGIPHINLSGEREEYGYLRYNGEKMEHYTYTTEDFLSGSIIVGDPQSKEATSVGGAVLPPAIGMNNPILSFDGTRLEEKELLIRIWIEGTDREADAALNGGEMIYKFAFCGIVKGGAEENELTYKDSGLYYGTEPASDLVYSVNGIDWLSYSNETLKNAISDSVKKFYVRVKETAASKAGAVYTVDRVAKTVTPF